jgi:sulfate permease, SulP family
MDQPETHRHESPSPRWRRFGRYVPILDWGRRYRPATLADDSVAALIVTAMLVPQALAYALLAGLPAQVGLYASVVPLVAYALLGTSRTLAVGPVAIVSLMTAAALSQIAPTGTEEYVAAALVLALLSGLMLFLTGLFRLGFLANFLSHPVIAGFVTASAILIATSQLRHILGVEGSGRTLVEMLGALVSQISELNLATVILGASLLALLLATRSWLAPSLIRIGLRPRAATMAAKLAPLAAVVASTALAAALDLPARGVEVLGEIPRSLPPLTVPSFELDLLLQLIGAAALISIVGFAESVSVAQTLAARRRQRIDPDQELVGLGASNLAAAFTGGYPVTGGFSRSVVAFDAGARTPAAGILTAAGVAATALLLTPLLSFLPKATLAAIIIVAVVSLLDFGVLLRTWRYSKKDFSAVAVTLAVTLGVGVEAGLLAGVATSIALFLLRTSRPHIAVVGLVPGTEHYRNVRRHAVKTSRDVLSVRIDESLYFANARYLEDSLDALVAERPTLRHVILMCTAVNEIDASALESLEAINRRLRERGVTLHLSEVKGPVMDRLKTSDLLENLSGQVFLTQHRAIETVAPGLLDRSPA